MKRRGEEESLERRWICDVMIDGRGVAVARWRRVVGAWVRVGAGVLGCRYGGSTTCLA